jgi:hypothetical protein
MIPSLACFLITAAYLIRMILNFRASVCILTSILTIILKSTHVQLAYCRNDTGRETAPRPKFDQLVNAIGGLQ